MHFKNISFIHKKISGAWLASAICLTAILTILFFTKTIFAARDLAGVSADDFNYVGYEHQQSGDSDISDMTEAERQDIAATYEYQNNQGLPVDEAPATVADEAQFYNYLLHNYIIIPAKWIDGAVTKAFAILIPIQGVAAYDMAAAMKDVEEAIRGSNENLKKNKQAYLDGLEAAQKGQGQIKEINTYFQESPDLQKVLAESQDIMAALNREFAEKQNAKNKNPIVDLSNVAAIQPENIFEQNQKTLKELFENIVSSDAAESLKKKSSIFLDIVNSGIQSIDPKLVKAIVIESLGDGLKTHLLCDLTVAGGGLVLAGPAGSAATIISCQPMCAALGAAGAITGGIRAGLDNLYFREGGSSVKEQNNRATTNQIKKYQEQLEQNGAESLQKSKSSIEAQLSMHKKKLNTITKEGGYTSNVEKEIRNFEGELEAIDNALKHRGGNT